MKLGARTAEKTLVDDLRDVERHAAALIAANARIVARGHTDARFSAIDGGEPYLANWRQWVRTNLDIEL